MTYNVKAYKSRSISSYQSIVHVEYNPAALPPVPSPDWTRFVCISDTHTQAFEVPEGDVLLHSGDLTDRGTVAEFTKTMDWLCGLPHKIKIIIAGNHDLTLHTEWYELESNHSEFHYDVGKQDVSVILKLLTGERARAAGVIYLQDSSYNFKVKPDGRTWSVYGSPWSPYFLGWAFGYEREDAEDFIAKIHKTDILLSHGPPAGIFDGTSGGSTVGCEALRGRLPFLRPRLHVFGHIHEGHGAYIHPWSAQPNSEPPAVQNDHFRPEGELGDDEGIPFDVDDIMSHDIEKESNVITNEAGEGDQTVFINAATWPAGPGSRRGELRVPHGGPGFQPVVVDLRD